MTKRIGFACKYLHQDQTLPARLLEDIQRPLTEKCTTVAWLNRQTKNSAEERLWDIMVHNSQAALRLVEYVGGLPSEQRMVRLGSNQLPMYTQDQWRYYWQLSDVKAYAESAYQKVGDRARELDVRLSMHPGQFCVLASDREDVVQRSIEEFEYHCDLIRWMGYGKTFQDFKCNVHISGKRGPQGIVDVLSKLSPEARNTITIENDENSWGLDASLELEKFVPLVLDIHHHWCHSSGEYIYPSDDRFKRIVDSWRGVRPVIHYSISREEYLQNTPIDQLPQFDQLVENGYKKQKLRAHSDWFNNQACNDWALSFLPYADIMCEAKAKNLSSTQLYEQYLFKTQIPH